MNKILLTKDYFVCCFYEPEGEIELEVSDDILEMTSECEIGKIWKYDPVSKIFSKVDYLGNDILKEMRQSQCFDIIDNRSQLWFNHLSLEQQKELDEWYTAWLNVTETKVIPTKPEWLK